MRSWTELSQFPRLLLSTLSIKLSYIVSSAIFICCLVVSSVQEMNSTAFMLKIDQLSEKTNDNFKLNLYRNADNFCLFFCEYCIVNFYFETYLYQYKEKMSKQDNK